MIRFLVALALLLFALPALAQDNPEAEKSYFTSFLQNQLSTPNRQISISGISGALSSNATIGEISVADREGVWLRIRNASIVWSRTALILRQRLEVEKLSAEKIEVFRKPLPEEGLPKAESSGFSIPELPIAVNLEQLSIGSVSFGQSVFGLKSELALSGSLRLEDGALDTKLDVKRLDGPGGELKLAAAYANETRNLDLDLSLSEPADGVLANVANIEGRPPVTLTLKGSGPLDTLDLALNLALDGQPTLDGKAELRRRDNGLGFGVKLAGPVARLVPARFRDFFGDQTQLAANGVVKDEGGFSLDELTLTSAALRLQAAAETGADNFLRKLKLDASLENPGGERVILPVPGGNTSVGSGRLTLDFGNTGSDEWNGELDVAGLDTGTFSAEKLKIELGGLAQNLDDPSARRVSFAAKGDVSGIDAKDADVAKALGRRIALDIEGDWHAGEPVKLAKAELSGNGLSAALAGEIRDFTYVGKIAVKAASIAPFSGIAGRDLSGSLDLNANGKVKPVGGGFDLTLDSRARELRIGTEAVDNLLDGTTTVTGHVARSEEGLRADDLKIENQQFQLAADGTFATGKADFDFDATLADLGLVSEQASGKLTAHGSAKGEKRIALAFKADVPSGTLAGKKLSNATVGFDGTLQESNVEGKLTGDAFLDGVRATLATDIAVVDGTKRLSDLSFIAGGAKLTGNVTQDKGGLLDGKLTLDAPDISTAAALALVEASGAVNADIELSNARGVQTASIDGDISRLEANGAKIGKAQISATAEDLFGVPVVDGSLTADDVSAGGVDVTHLEAKATRSGETTNFSADAHLANEADISAAGSLTPRDQGFRLRLEKAELTKGNTSARLRKAASLDIAGSNVSFDEIALDVGGGHLTARGRIADSYDVSVDVEKLPLSIANTVKPDLGLGGVIGGNARVTGPRDKPQVRFDLTADDIAAAALKQAGLSTIDVRARGTTSGDRLTIDASVKSPEGLDASAKGDVPLGGDGQMALDVRLASFPLAALNSVVKGQDLSGKLSGSARITGTLSAPKAAFDLDGQRISAAPIANLGAAPLNVTASGTYEGKSVTLSSVKVSGPQGLDVTARGRVPLSGNGLDINVAASVPLALADRLLAERGAVVDGTLRAQARVTGSLKKPVINGDFSTAGARAQDPQSNVRLDAINVAGTISGDTVNLRTATASLGAGGRISAAGTISTNAAAGFPANIRVKLDNARYADGQMVVATVNGSLSVSGALTRDPLLAGDIRVERAELTIPSSFGSGAASLDVKHIHAPPAVRRTLERARADDGTPMPSARPSVMKVDIRISAPNRIFVRGRGLDTELGGRVRLTGPITNIQPVGGFKLVRGRLSILGKRITFDEGTVTLIGDLDPFVNFVARSENSDITVFITVSGRVSDPKIAFSSEPNLPQDEVLARLIFNRGLDELSPFQIARLAAAAAELAGGSGTSLLDQLRGAAGLDDLDVVTDSEGNTAVKAGRYIQDNIYLGVEAGSGGTTKGTVNLDITKDLKAKGAVGSDGDSSFGLFYERDY